MIIRNLTPSDGDVWGIPGDIHADKQDDNALRVMTKVWRANYVNGVILVGDTFESAGISRHGRPGRAFRFGRGTIAAEEKAIKPWLEQWDALVSSNGGRKNRLHVLTGNHENWWEGVQDEYPGLSDTPWSDLYGDAFDGWHVHKEYVALRLHNLLICHGHRVRGSLSKQSASSVLANYPGQNTLYGHTHRVDQATVPTLKYGVQEDHGAWTIGHMKCPVTELKDKFSGPLSERHKQGFGLVHFKRLAGDLVFKVSVGTIDRTKGGKPYCIFNGELYD